MYPDRAEITLTSRESLLALAALEAVLEMNDTARSLSHESLAEIYALRTKLKVAAK